MGGNAIAKALPVVGAVIGSIVPGVGTAAGMAAGAALGGVAGTAIMKYPKPPTPLAPAPMPDQSLIADTAQTSLKAQLARRGRASTVLAGDTGDKLG